MIQKGARVLRTYAWFLPFICFISGYYAASKWIEPVHVAVPAIVGSNVLEGFSTLARCHLNMRLLEERYHEDIPEGTVLEQHPTPGGTVRLHHHVYVVIARKPPLPPTPDFLGKHISTIRRVAQSEGVKTELYHVPGSGQTVNQCFAQSPAPDTPINKKTDRVIVYLAPHEPCWHIMPNLLDRPLSDADVLRRHETVTLEVIHRDPGKRRDKVIIEQVPRAGELVDMRKKLPIQLLVD